MLSPTIVPMLQPTRWIGSLVVDLATPSLPMLPLQSPRPASSTASPRDTLPPDGAGTRIGRSVEGVRQARAEHREP